MDTIHKRFTELTEPRGENKKLGEYLGVHPNTVCGWRKGLSKNFHKYIPQIAKYYDVNVAWLSGLSDDKYGHKKSALAVSDEDEDTINEIVEIMKTKTKEQREAFLQFLRSNP